MQYLLKHLSTATYSTVPVQLLKQFGQITVYSKVIGVQHMTWNVDLGMRYRQFI